VVRPELERRLADLRVAVSTATVATMLRLVPRLILVLLFFGDLVAALILALAASPDTLKTSFGLSGVDGGSEIWSRLDWYPG
jgi:hypothetical protein